MSGRHVIHTGICTQPPAQSSQPHHPTYSRTSAPAEGHFFFRDVFSVRENFSDPHEDRHRRHAVSSRNPAAAPSQLFAAPTVPQTVLQLFDPHGGKVGDYLIVSTTCTSKNFSDSVFDLAGGTWDKT